MGRSDCWYDNFDMSFDAIDYLCKILSIPEPNKKGYCPKCKRDNRFCAIGNIYTYTLKCGTCGLRISPLTYTYFKNTNIHLIVILKAIYILKIKNPSILIKNLAIELNVSEVTARSLKRKILNIREKGVEYKMMLHLKDKIEQNYSTILSEKPEKPILISL